MYSCVWKDLWHVVDWLLINCLFGCYCSIEWERELKHLAKDYNFASNNSTYKVRSCFHLVDAPPTHTFIIIKIINTSNFTPQFSTNAHIFLMFFPSSTKLVILHILIFFPLGLFLLFPNAKPQDKRQKHG
jgi:hypothetical protein